MRYENSFRYIVIFVISFHLSAIGLCYWTGIVPQPKKVHEKLVVKTVSLKKNLEPVAIVEKAPQPTPKPEPVATPKPELRPEPEPEPEPTPIPAVKPKPPPKPVPKPKPEPKPKELPKAEPKPVNKAPQKKVLKEEKKSVVKKTTPPEKKPKISQEDLRKQELIAQAQALFANTGNKSSKKSSKDNTLVSLNTLSKLEIDSSPRATDKEKRYQEILAEHLKERLRFPEYGEVKIKLTLSNAGKVIKVEIVSSKSDENRKYAVKALPDILFPSFDTFIKEDKHTFSITLKND